MSEPYSLRFTEQAETDLRQIDKATGERIFKKMMWVAENASTLDHVALKGEWSGLYRWRIGDYRAIYAIVHEIPGLIVVLIGHRRDVYE